jgi:Holliday junction resolvase
VPKVKIQNDSNAKQIVQALRDAGAVVHFWVPAQRQKGNPDLVVAFKGAMYLIEIKGQKTPLTDAQVKFHDEWLRMGGCVVHVCRTPEQALIAIGVEPAF